MNIYSDTINALKAHEDANTDTYIAAIALNYHLASIDVPKKTSRMFALPLSYRRKNDLLGTNRHASPGTNLDITLMEIDEYGKPVRHYNDSGYATRHLVNFSDNLAPDSTAMMKLTPDGLVWAYTRNKNDYWVISVENDGDVPVIKWKIKNPDIVFDLTHKEVNKLVQDEMDNLPLNTTSTWNIHTNKGHSKTITSLCYWPKWFELLTNKYLNNQAEEAGIQNIWLPVDLRDSCSKTKIADLKNKKAIKPDGTPKYYPTDRTNHLGKMVFETKPRVVQIQQEGSDLTLHAIGNKRKKKDLMETLTSMDVKIDYYAGHTGNACLECYELKEGSSTATKKGWIWNNTEWIAYVVDDKIYIIKLSKLRNLVEQIGEPQFEEFNTGSGHTMVRANEPFKPNTYDDEYNPRTGAGKYNVYIPLTDAIALASRTITVLPADLSHIADSAAAYRAIEGEYIAKSRDGWLTRMVELNEKQKQLGA